MDINTFYDSTLSEIFFVCRGYENRLKAQYNIQFSAFFNAYGAFKGGKKFKPFDLFGENNKPKQAYQKVDDKTRDREVGYLQSLVDAQQGKG